MKKTILITGSTDGIGKLTAMKFAKKDHTVYIHGRSQQKVFHVVNEIKALTNNEDIYGLVADFSQLHNVKALANQLLDKLERLDVLINNAGVYNSVQTTNPSGLDMRFAVNFYAPYILTNSLKPVLVKTENARVLNLSSAAQSPFTVDELIGEQLVSVSEAYAKSKLALTMWSFHLAKTEDSIKVIAVNPGSLLNTKMVKEAFGHHLSPADKGASILYELVISTQFKDVSGQYFDNDRGDFGSTHADAYNAAKVQALVNATHQVVTSL